MLHRRPRCRVGAQAVRPALRRMSNLSGIGAIICRIAAFMHDFPAAIQQLIYFVESLLTLSFLKRRHGCSQPFIRSETGFPTSRRSAQIGLRSKKRVPPSASPIPGALGVQEGGYILLVGLYGISPEAGLVLSLTKRIPDLLIGMGGLIAWLGLESGHIGPINARSQAPRTPRRPPPGSFR